MKVFFTSSITGLKTYKKNCKKISRFLRDQGHSVHDGFLRITKEEDQTYTKKRSKHVFKFITDRINEADVFIAEMSYRSAPVSYQITYALEHNKPSLYLVEKGRGNPPHAVFKGNPSKYLIVKEYTFDEVEDVVDEFLKKSEHLLMRRFNFLLPAELDEYLRISAAINRTSKGEFLRELIENKMEGDSRYNKISNIQFDPEEQ